MRRIPAIVVSLLLAMMMLSVSGCMERFWIKERTRTHHENKEHDKKHDHDNGHGHDKDHDDHDDRKDDKDKD